MSDISFQTHSGNVFFFFHFKIPLYGILVLPDFSLSTRICVFSLGYFDSADLVSCLLLEMFRRLSNGEDESVNIQQVWENHSREEHVGSREDHGGSGNSLELESSIISAFLRKFSLAAGIAALRRCSPFFSFRKTLCPV